MKRKDCYVLRKVAGKYVIMPTGEESFQFNGMISINETGALLWEKLAEDVTEEELVSAICSEYNIDEQTAVSDVRDFINEVKNSNLIN